MNSNQADQINAICCRRTRLVETITQTVTEVWNGNYLTKYIFTDMTQYLTAFEYAVPQRKPLLIEPATFT